MPSCANNATYRVNFRANEDAPVVKTWTRRLPTQDDVLVRSRAHSHFSRTGIHIFAPLSARRLHLQ